MRGVALLVTLSFLHWPAQPAPNTREVRLWLDYGLLVPSDAIRLVQDGSHVRGTIAHWWPADTDARDLIVPGTNKTFEQMQTAHCSAILRDGETTACVEEMSERAAARLLECFTRLGIWQLHDPCPQRDDVVTVTADGDSLDVDLHQPGGPMRSLKFVTSSEGDERFDATAANLAAFAKLYAESSAELGDGR